MRVISFPQTSGVVHYPDTPDLFKHGKFVGDNLICEYHGDDDSIESYDGEWPIVTPQYNTMMYPDELRAQLTDEEIAAAPDRLEKELAMAARIIDVSSDRIREGLSSFLDADRVNELTRGLPI